MYKSTNIWAGTGAAPLRFAPHLWIGGRAEGHCLLRCVVGYACAPIRYSLISSIRLAKFAHMTFKLGQQGIARDGFGIRQANDRFIWTVDINISRFGIDEPAELRPIGDVFPHLVFHGLKTVCSGKQFDDKIGTNRRKFLLLICGKCLPSLFANPSQIRCSHRAIRKGETRG